MSKAIEQLKSGLIVGHFGFGEHASGIGTPAQTATDGDTVNARALGNLSVRFLSNDTPECRFPLPGDPERFLSTSNPEWEDFLSNPFAAKYGPLVLDAGLKAYLLPRLKSGTAANHHRHAKNAEAALESEIKNDMTQMNWSKEKFEFFLAFAHEVTDRYGRLLAYINRKDASASRPADYNTRQLEKGVACAYFIWPNVGKFTGAASITDLVLKPSTANQWATKDKYLQHSREAVATARQNKFGIFDKTDPLMIEPFELRYLAGRRAPNRWVIDLSKKDDVLIAPQNYYQVPHMEDRLFLPEEYVSLFVAKGWKEQVVAAPAAAISTAA